MRPPHKLAYPVELTGATLLLTLVAMRCIFKAAFALLLLLAAATHSRGQIVDLAAAPHSLVQLDGLWRFHPGDDPAWASPSFNDTGWPLLRADRDWSRQGYESMSGLAWYRFQIVIPANAPAQAIEIPRLYTSYELFADGVRLGGLGEMPPRPVARSPQPRVFPLTAPQPFPRTVSLAIRVWHDPMWAMYYGGGPAAATYVGDTRLIDARVRQRIAGRAWEDAAALFLVCFELLAAAAALVFFSLRPLEREYLWFSLMLFASAAERCLTIWAHNHAMPVLTRSFGIDSINVLYFVFSLAFYVRLLRSRRSRWFAFTASCVVATAFVPFPIALGWYSVATFNLLGAILLIPATVWIITLLLRAYRQRIADVRLLLVPAMLQQLLMLYDNLQAIPFTAGSKVVLPDISEPLAHWPFTFNLLNLGDAFFLVTMIIILILRFTRTRCEEDRYAAELDAANSVQHVLIPDWIPQIPGLTIGSAYHPAGEVGGDFFQVIPLADGALIAIGDVSGKGLPAAMSVALIIGALRSLAEQTHSPAAILAGLNRSLHSRSATGVSEGFTTCLVLHAASSGAVTLASAGHLPPYVNGEELSLHHALPLGVIEDSTYLETHAQLAQGDHLTLLSDGVVEARSPSGELFGFERTRAISRTSAAEIAHAAVTFRRHRPQDDDITVLTLIGNLAGAAA